MISPTPKVLTEADLAGLPRAVSLPEPSFRLVWLSDRAVYKVNKPNIDTTDCYTPDVVRALVSERDALAGRVAELEAERDRALRNRDMWKGQCERQAETLSMYHAKSAGLERDGLRYRHMRDLRIEQTGMPGQPCIAMPNGMQSGYYLTEETADHAVDTSIAALSATTPESKP